MLKTLADGSYKHRRRYHTLPATTDEVWTDEATPQLETLIWAPGELSKSVPHPVISILCAVILISQKWGSGIHGANISALDVA